jgi:aminoglycoside phosphotransferase (APT) family kinase protein
MCHGDLIPSNVVVEGGRLRRVPDTGGFAAADPALGLVAGWHLLADGPRERFRAGLGCGDLEWERGKAWAFQQAAGACWYYRHTNPAMTAMGRTTLSRILDIEL